jgi:membrane protein YqaA with SNARE-associated domain
MTLRTLYDWTLRKAATPAAELWLAVTAFIESSVFLIPADVLFVPMALAKPMRAYRYALTAGEAITGDIRLTFPRGADPAGQGNT